MSLVCEDRTQYSLTKLIAFQLFLIIRLETILTWFVKIELVMGI